jgi:2-oxoglutarate dehydrogenase E2 component (dihydrolipoamide succinyltransferase)
MGIDIKVPGLPESVADATVSTWHKQPGEPVKRDENLVDIETDKIMLEVVAPADGTLEKILKNTGAIVKADEVIATFAASTVGTASGGKTTQAAGESSANQTTTNNTKTATQSNATSSATTAASSSTSASNTNSSQVQSSTDALSPSMRRALGEQEPGAKPATPASNNVAQTNVANTGIAPSTISASAARFEGRIEKRVPMTRLRAKIAERLLQAQHSAAILTTFNEINMAPVIALRNSYKDEFMQKYGVRLGYMSFFVSAVIAALKKFPTVNASIDGNDIVYHGYFDIGIAVSTERGLVVPILRDAESMSMAEIEQSIVKHSNNARDGKLSMEDITGGTFSITNGGVFGSLFATPILNPPQSAILGMHKIMERPVVENKQIVIRPMMYVALSYDHRIIDGAESVQFLVTVKEMLEDPARLVLSI